MAGSSPIELKSPAMWEAYSKGIVALGLNLPLKPLSCPCVTCLRDVEGGGLLADG
jgi:hypothetical protein